MQEAIDDTIIRSFDPNQSYLWKWVPSRGKSGGILSGIKLDLLDVGTFKEGKYMLQLNLWDKMAKKNWNFLNIYGVAHEENKLEFLAELANFCSTNKEPLIIGRDFNIIRFSSEKIKVACTNAHVFSTLSLSGTTIRDTLIEVLRSL